MKYDKPSLSFEEQADLLIIKGDSDLLKGDSDLLTKRGEARHLFVACRQARTSTKPTKILNFLSRGIY